MRIRILISVVALAVTSSFLVGQPPMPTPQKEHDWLKQFVGEWESEGEGTMGPGQPAMQCKGTMSTRMLGGFWMISDIKGDMMGAPVQAVHTVGYDTQAKKYIGTWVDSVMNHMWTYSGSVDSSGKILTLEADGPDMTKPGKMAKYRDVYEFKSKDHFTMSSQMFGEDGKWHQFMTSNVHRKKK